MSRLSIKRLREVVTYDSNVNRRAYGKSGYKGVYWAPHAGRWFAQITSERKARFLGYFDDPKEANAVYFAAAKKVHGEFANAG